jgi:penicillin amidase
VLDKNSAAAALFEVWLRRLSPSFLETQFSRDTRELASRSVDLPTMIRKLRESPEDLRRRVMLQSLAEAYQQASQLLGDKSSAWRWGDLHTILFAHPLADTPPRQKLFNLGPIERGGDAQTPNATSGPGFKQSAGASYRHILDLADWDRSVFTSAPGQSGQPGSPHYADLLPLWAERKYSPLAYTRTAVEKHTSHKLILEPK